MILCIDTTAGKGERARAGAGSPPGQKAGGEGWSGLRRIAYVTINNGA